MARLPDDTGMLSVGAPLVSGARLPAMQAPVGNAASGLSAILGALEEFAAPFEAARRENLYADHKRASLEKMTELQTALETEQDPLVIDQKWREGMAAIEAEHRQTLHGEGAVLNAWSSWFQESAMRSGVAVARLMRQRVVDQGRAGLAASLDTYYRALPLSREDDDVEHLKTSALAEIEAKLGAGIISTQEAQAQWQRFNEGVDGYLVERDLHADPAAALDRLKDPENYRHLDPHKRAALTAKAQGLAESARDERMVEEAFGWADRRFADHEAAVAWFEDPKNDPPGMTLSLRQRNAVTRQLAARAATQRSRRAEAESRAVRSEQDAVFAAMRGGDFDEAQRIVDHSRVLDYGFRVRITEAVAKAGDGLRTDPRVKAEALVGIRSGEITDPAQIDMLVGAGLSPQDADALKTDLEKSSLPPGFNPWTISFDKFKQKYAKDQDMLDLFPEFALALDWYVREEGLKGRQIMDKADWLLETVNPQAWFGKRSRVEDMFKKQKVFPHRDATAGGPAAIPAGEDIPLEHRTRIEAALRERGLAVTDANVVAIWRQRQGR